MRAVWVEAFGPLSTIGMVDHAPEPVAADGEVVVEVAVAEANYPDLLVIEGNYQVKPPLPFAPGKAATGTVRRLGRGVTDLRPGDRVALQVEFGAFAQQVRVPASACHVLPSTLPFDIAAALGLTYQTAWFALARRARVQPGERVLVLGAAGGVGVASLHVARALGASCVIAGVRGERNAEVAWAAGADHVIEVGRPDLHDALRREVSEVADGGVDVVIDPVGGAAGAAALRALAWCGRLVVIGFAAGDIPTYKANYLLVKNIAVLGLQWSDYRDREPAAVAQAQSDIFRWYAEGRFAPHIDVRLPLSEFAQALELLRAGQARGKILLEVTRS